MIAGLERNDALRWSVADFLAVVGVTLLAAALRLWRLDVPSALMLANEAVCRSDNQALKHWEMMFDRSLHLELLPFDSGAGASGGG